MNPTSEVDQEYYRRFPSLGELTTPTINADDLVIKTFDACPSSKTRRGRKVPPHCQRTYTKTSSAKKADTEGSCSKIQSPKTIRAAAQTTITTADTQPDASFYVDLSRCSRALYRSFNSQIRNGIARQLSCLNKCEITLQDMRSLKSPPKTSKNDHHSKLARRSPNSDMNAVTTPTMEELFGPAADTINTSNVNVAEVDHDLLFNQDECLIDEHTNQNVHMQDLLEEIGPLVPNDISEELGTTSTYTAAVPTMHGNLENTSHTAATAAATVTSVMSHPPFEAETTIDLQSVPAAALTDENVRTTASVLKTLSVPLFNDFERVYRIQEGRDRERAYLKEQLAGLQSIYDEKSARCKNELRALRAKIKPIQARLKQIDPPIVTTTETSDHVNTSSDVPEEI